MNFSYDFEGQPPDFQGDSFCDDTDGNWDSIDYGEKLLFCFLDYEEFIGTSISVLTKVLIQVTAAVKDLEEKIMEILGILGMQNGQILLLCMILLCLFRMGELFLFRGDKLGAARL